MTPEQFISLHQTMPWFTFVIVCVLGLVVGSFLNVVIFRLPVMLYKEWKAACDEMQDELPKDLPEGR